MKHNLKEYLRILKIEKKKRRQFVSLMTAMSFIVSGGVFWQLRSVGNALVDDRIHGPDSGNENAVPISSEFETPSVWENTLPKELSDNISENMVLVARSQLDYTEDADNYILSDDGTVKCGYTRYGAWYGNPYGEWNTLFTYFCMHYAGVDEDVIPYGSGCRVWTLNLEEKGLLIPPDEASPQSGDVVIIDSDNNGIADRSGIISEISDNAENKTCITVIEGDINGKVGISSYLTDDPALSGFVSMDHLMEKSGVPPDEEQTADAADSPDILIDSVPEWSFSSVSESGIKVEASAYISAFPMNTIMEVVDASDNNAIEKAAEVLNTDPDSISAVAVDISFRDAEGNELEPAENSEVKVKIILPDKKKLSGNEFSLIHLADDGSAETVEDAELSEYGAEFTADEFSTYILTVNGEKEHKDLVLLNGETGTTSADNPYVIYSGETLEVTYQGDQWNNINITVYNNGDGDNRILIPTSDTYSSNSSEMTFTRKWTANKAGDVTVQLRYPYEDIYIRVVQPKSYMIVNGSRVPLPRALEMLHNEKLTDDKIIYSDVGSSFKISVDGGAEHLIAKDYNQSEPEYDLADGFLHRGAPDYSDGNTTIEFTCLKEGTTYIDVNGETIKVIIGRAAYMKMNDGRRLTLDEALDDLNGSTANVIYAYEGEVLNFSVDGYRFHLFDITSGKNSVLSMPTDASSSELYENGNTVVPITCMKEGEGTVKIGDHEVKIIVQHPLYLKTAIMDRDIDRVNEWLPDVYAPKKSGYIANNFNVYSTDAYNNPQGRLFPYYVHIGDEFEIFTTNDYGCLSDPNYTVEYLNVGVEPTGTWGENSWYDRYTIYGVSNETLMYEIPPTETGKIAKKYKAVNSGYARITLKDGNRSIRTMYVQILPESDKLLDHADIEISDGGIYTLTKVTRHADGTIEKIITQYEAYVSEINRSTLYKNADDTCTFYQTVNNGLEVLEGVSGYERENYWKDENIQPGDPQYEYTSKYAKDKNGNYTYWSNIKYYADDVDHAVFDTDLMLIPSKFKTTVYNEEGTLLSESDYTEVEDKTPRYLSNVKFTMDHQDVLDAFNKCPNHTGLDFTIMAYSAMVEFDLSKELTGGTVEDGQFSFEVLQKEVKPVRTWLNGLNLNKSDCSSLTASGLKYKAAYRVFYDQDTKWGEGIDSEAVIEELHSIAGFENLNSAGDVFNIANNDSDQRQNTVLNVLKKHFAEPADVEENDTQYTMDNEGFYLLSFESEPVQVSSNDANGIVTFNTLHFEKSGIYNYIIREIIPENASDILYDNKEIDLMIDVNSVNKQLTADITSNLSNLNFINRKAYTLPETGGCGTVVYVITGMAFISGAAALLIIKRRKEDS